MDAIDLKELRRKVEFRCERLREEIAASGNGMKEVELTVIEAQSIIELLQTLLGHLESA